MREFDRGSRWLWELLILLEGRPDLQFVVILLARFYLVSGARIEAFAVSILAQRTWTTKHIGVVGSEPGENVVYAFSGKNWRGCVGGRRGECTFVSGYSKIKLLFPRRSVETGSNAKRISKQRFYFNSRRVVHARFFKP